MNTEHKTNMTEGIGLNLSA